MIKNTGTEIIKKQVGLVSKGNVAYCFGEIVVSEEFWLKMLHKYYNEHIEEYFGFLKTYKKI